MKYLKPLAEQVIAITGASSGIGLATAQSAARCGARLVLAARDEEALSRIARELSTKGSRAVPVTADVSIREDLEKIAETAHREFGGFDTWVNNAGTSIWGRLEEVSDEDARRLFDVNFWGVVNGSLIAVKHLKRHGGALINMGSVASEMAIPIQGFYSATKHAVKAFTDALRIELMDERAPVSVTLIKPTSIDTPFPQNAKNYTDREPKLPPPVYHPREVAAAILHAATHGIREIYVGGSGRVMVAAGRQAPRAMDWVSKKVMIPQQFRRERPREADGALHRPGHGGRVRGSHPGFVRPASVYARMVRHPVFTGLAAAAAGYAAASFVMAKNSKTNGYDNRM